METRQQMLSVVLIILMNPHEFYSTDLNSNFEVNVILVKHIAKRFHQKVRTVLYL